MSKFRIAALISGGGTTLRNLIEKIDAGKLDVEIGLVIASTARAGGIQFAEQAGIPVRVVEYSQQPSIERFSKEIFDAARRAQCDLVVMAGFLKRVLIPDDFADRVINIHPSLIPAFCGHGYYGRRVHQAVLDSGCKVTGCTVHFVDDEYDHGPIIAQRAVEVQPGDDAERLAKRVFAEECELYPEVISEIARRRQAGTRD